MAGDGSSDGFSALQGQQFINLTTFRKNGLPVVTPVWFAEASDRLYVMTTDGSGKVKRLRNNGRVEVAPSNRRGTPLGPAALGTARLLTGEAERTANLLLTRKYGLQKRLFDLAQKFSARQRVYIEIVPERHDDRRNRSA